MSIEYNVSKLKEFIPKYQGQLVAAPDGSFPGQCVSLVKQWLDFCGWPALRGNAINWQYNGDGKTYKFFKNYAWTVPNPGDMCVFKVGPYGHIGIVVQANLSNMLVFNQNWPQGNTTDPAKLTSFDYRHPICIGFLRKL